MFLGRIVEVWIENKIMLLKTEIQFVLFYIWLTANNPTSTTISTHLVFYLWLNLELHPCTQSIHVHLYMKSMDLAQKSLPDFNSCLPTGTNPP